MYHIIPWESKSRIWLLYKRIASGCKHERSIISCSMHCIRGFDEGRWTMKEERKRVAKELNGKTATLKFC